MSINNPQKIFISTHSTTGIGQCDCDCDCACSLPQQTCFSLELAQVENLHIADFKSLPLYGDLSICFGPSCRPSVLNQTAISLLDEINGQSFVSAQNILAQAHGKPQARAFLDKVFQAGFITDSHSQYGVSDLLTAWVHVTDRCNLRCEYCYLPHHPEDMDVQTGMEIMKTLVSSAKDNQYKKIKIKFAGGEPVLQFGRIKEWHSFAEKLATQAHIELDAIILSNGTLLTTEIARVMKARNIRLMISLDGLQQAHDVQRHFADGRGSFNQTVRGIDIAIAAGLAPHISVTVSNRNVQQLPELVSWLLARDLGFNLNFVRSHEYTQGIADAHLLINSLKQVLEMLQEYPAKRGILNGLVDRVNLSASRTHACAIERDYVVFDVKGQVARCQMELHKAISCQGIDPVHIIRNTSNPINLPISQKAECAACDWRYWCAGGCPLLQESSPYCAVYKSIFPEVLRAEGFRLLRKNHLQGI